MDFLKRITVVLYVTIILFLSCTAILFALQWMDVKMFSNLLRIFQADENLRMITAISGCVLLLVNFFFFRTFSQAGRDKIIAFDNPSGRVSVSLGALQDLIRRSISTLDEVKTASSVIRTTKKGLAITINLTLRSDVNIPAVTDKVQTLVREKIQDTIGMEESVDISVYVGRIIREKVYQNKKIKEKKEKSPKQPQVPFQGYRA